MASLYIMRHGTTEWNEQHRLQGRTDIPLNAAGRDMAREAGEKYADLHFDICFASPLTRAYETAEIFLQGRDLQLVTDERLVEMCFGTYEGLANSFDIPDCPVNVIFKHPELYKSSVGGAETFDDLFARTGEFLDKKVYPLIREGKDVLIVGHGAMNSSIISHVKGLPIEQFWSAGLEQCRPMKLI